MAQIKRIGFGQVEPNHLSGIVDGSIYAQLPVNRTTMGDVIENGRFAKYDMAVARQGKEGEYGEVNLTGAGQWLMIYNEQKLYDERYQRLRDFAMVASNYTDGEIYPRLIEVNVGDIFTTNTFGANTSNTAEVGGVTLAQGDSVIIGADGYLTAGEAVDGEPAFIVARVYTMPDGQPGVKLQRVQ